MFGLPRGLLTPLLLAAAIVGLGVGLWFHGPAAPPPAIPGLLWPSPRTLSPFSLVDQRGEPFTLERLQGRWSFLFFGFTHCPDICPTTLGTLAMVERRLAQDPALAADTQVVFVSVDPERDAGQALANYVAHFGPRILGATGSQEELASLARQLGVLFVRNAAEPGGNYSVDHSASVLLVDPRGRLVGLFPVPHEAGAIAENYRRIRAWLQDEAA